MRGLLAAGFVFFVVAAVATVALGPPGWGAAAGADVQLAGWGGELSPWGLIVGLIVLFVVVKLVFRLAAGPRWDGGPWRWHHAHAAQDGRDHGGPATAFRRWHDEAHASTGEVDRDRPAAAAARQTPAAPSPDPDATPRAPGPSQAPPPAYPHPASPSSPWPAPGQVPQGPYPSHAPAPPPWPTPMQQPPQWPYPGQPPQWPYPGQQTPWPYPGQPQWPDPGQPPARPDR